MLRRHVDGHVQRQRCGEPRCVHPEHQEPISRVALNGDAPALACEFDGRPLRAARVAAGLSLTALADRAGVEPSTVVRMEQGRSQPNPATLAKPARALGVPVAEMVAEEG